MKKLFSILLIAVLLVGLSIPSYAGNKGVYSSGLTDEGEKKSVQCSWNCADICGKYGGECSPFCTGGGKLCTKTCPIDCYGDGTKSTVKEKDTKPAPVILDRDAKFKTNADVTVGLGANICDDWRYFFDTPIIVGKPIKEKED